MSLGLGVGKGPQQVGGWRLIQVGGLTEKEGRTLVLPITVTSWANLVKAGASDGKSLPEYRPHHLSYRQGQAAWRKGSRPGAGIGGRLLSLVQNSFHPQSPHCSSWNCEAPVRVAEMSGEEMVDVTGVSSSPPRAPGNAGS